VAVTLGAGAPAQWAGDLLAIGVFEEAFATADGKPSIASPELAALDAELGGALSDIVSLFDFSGKAGAAQTLRAGKAARFVTLVGLGPAAKALPTVEWGASPWHALGAAVAAAAKANKATTAAVAVVGGAALSAETLAEGAGRVANGAVNGAFESTRFKSKPNTSPLASVQLLFAGGAPAVAAAVARGAAMARGALLTRYLVEAPANVCTPTYLAAAAAAVAAAAPDVMSLRVLEQDECEALGMGCFLGVSEASAEPPKFIHLTYSPPGGGGRKVAIVGKGLTFDSGGYNIKAGAGSMIELMKFDMGGAGATLGAARALADIRPPGVEVHFVIASCENMIDARGMRPGDVLVAANGTTVEIGNTDAEGRLTLADALLYAQGQCGAEAVVDIATLTGACMVALGGGIGGLYSPSDAVAAEVASAARAAGEKLWRMPLEASYKDLIKSPIADLKNTGGRMGGSITAALFLQEFVDVDKVEWAHLDIAGPVWDDKAAVATGFGAQLLAEWAVAQGARA
jgi:leucyl aminopeptidase